MMILNVKSELGLFWQYPNCQAFWSVSKRGFFIRMTTCFNSIDYWISSQQKSLYEDIHSIIWSFGWRLYPRYSQNKFINVYILLTQVETFPFPPFSLCICSVLIQSSKAMQKCYWSKVFCTTLWSPMSLPLELSAWLLHTKSCLGIWMFFVSQEGAHKITCSFGTWNAEYLSAQDVHS